MSLLLKIISGLVVALLGIQMAFSGSFDREFSIRAAIVFKISWFVQWPVVEGVDSNVLICAFRGDPVNKYFKDVVGLKSLGRPVTFEVLEKDSLLLEKCSILYLSKETDFSDYIGDIPKNVLTISDRIGFAKHDGMVEIGRRNEQMFFSIDLRRMKSSDISISSELLKLAVVVEDEGQYVE